MFDAHRPLDDWLKAETYSGLAGNDDLKMKVELEARYPGLTVDFGETSVRWIIPRPGQFRGNPDGIAGDVMPTPHSKEQRA